MRASTHLRLAAFALIAACALSPIHAEAGIGLPEDVVFTGWLRVEDHNVEDLVIMVEVAESCLYAEVLPTGRFTVAVPVGERALLAFIKPGHITKEVELDTRYSMANNKAARGNRTVKFDVVLEPEAKRPGRKYDGPVGSLGFHKGTGSTKVRHNLSVVADDQRRK